MSGERGQGGEDGRAIKCVVVGDGAVGKVRAACPFLHFVPYGLTNAHIQCPDGLGGALQRNLD